MTDAFAADGGTADKTPAEQDELSTLTSILAQLSRFDPVTRERIIHTITAFHGITSRGATSASSPQSGTASGGHTPVGTFSEDRSISPKQFMFEKQPRTDVEKVACLAYYLTHYRDLQYFKTLDISKLNTEASQSTML